MLEDIERATDRKSLAFLRMRYLDQDGQGVPQPFLLLIQECCQRWILLLITSAGNMGAPLLQHEYTIDTKRVLSVCRNVCSLDNILGEELGREGLHVILTKIMRLDPQNFITEEDQDTLIEIQDLAGEIAAMASTFPSRVAPYTRQELIDRLPLSFSISAVDDDERKVQESISMSVLINQVKDRQSSQADVGFLMWPSAVVLSRYLASNPEEVIGKNVLELGAGCGLAGLVAAQIKQRREAIENTSECPKVLLTDFNKVVVRNCKQNIALNGLQEFAHAYELDFYKQNENLDGWSDSVGSIRDQVDLILAADIICQPEDAFAAARSIFAALKIGGKALMVSADARHRFGVEKFEEACRLVGLLVSSEKAQNIYGGRLLSENMEKTTGYVDGMSLTMFTVTK